MEAGAVLCSDGHQVNNAGAEFGATEGTNKTSHQKVAQERPLKSILIAILHYL
jgi:hypothetical protein